MPTAAAGPNCRTSAIPRCRSTRAARAPSSRPRWARAGDDRGGTRHTLPGRAASGGVRDCDRSGHDAAAPDPEGGPRVAGKPLSEIVEAGWARALAPVEPVVAQMGEFLRAEIAAGRRYLPAGPNVLRAFTRPFADARVLIVGQDPYPPPGHAVGLSFSVAPEVRPIPRSLANIFQEYAADLGHPPPSCGDLTPWAQR